MERCTFEEEMESMRKILTLSTFKQSTLVNQWSRLSGKIKKSTNNFLTGQSRSKTLIHQPHVLGPRP